MLICCEGHTTKVVLFIDANDIFEAGYAVDLKEHELRELSDIIENGECPICNGFVPFERTVVEGEVQVMDFPTFNRFLAGEDITPLIPKGVMVECID